MDLVRLEKDIKEWETLKLWIETAKAKEMTLRKSIADRAFASKRLANGFLPEGTNRTTLQVGGGEYEAKMVQKLNRTVLSEMVGPTMTELVALNPLAADLIKTEYTVSVSTYKKLTTEQQAIADRMLVVKPGTVTLELNPVAAG